MLYGKKITVCDSGLKTLDEVRRSNLDEVSITSEVYKNALELDMIMSSTSIGRPERRISESLPAIPSSSGTDFGLGLAIGSILL